MVGSITPTAAKGVVNVVIEATPGEQQLLAPTAITSTMTLTTGPSGSTGMRLHLLIKYWTASGSLTLTGVGSPGNTETITVPAPTAQQLQSAQSWEYVSVNSYTSFTNITTTGLTNGQMEVRGVQGAKYAIPVTKYSSGRKPKTYSPKEYTGYMAADRKIIQTLNEVPIDSFESDFYGDLSLYWAYTMLGAPTGGWTSLPSTPLSIVASATITASMTIASQPAAPRMRLIIAVSGFTGNPSITIVGTCYGQSVSETITPTANGTYYSAYQYSAISSIGGTTNATTVAITGVFGWLGIFNGEQARYTSNQEFFDGVGSWVHPLSYFTDGEFIVSTKDSAKLTLKGRCQDKLAIGDRTTTPLSGTNRTTALAMPFFDLPVGGWQTQVFIDDINATPGTTGYGDPEEEIKIVLKCPVDPHTTFNNTQNITRIKDGKRECTVDVTTDIIDIIQHEKFRQNFAQYLVVKLLGEYIGTTGGVAYSKGWWWTLPIQYDGEYGQEGDPHKGTVTAKPKLRTRYDSGIGSSYQLQVVTTSPPNYTA
jgi:hypothetical protein